MRIVRWGLGGLGLLVASGVIAFSAVSFTGVAQAQEPGDGAGLRRVRAEKLAERLGISIEELRSDPKAARDQLIDRALANGRITAAQAAELKAQEPGTIRRGLRAGAVRVLRNVLDAAAQVIGIDRERVRVGLQGGQSLAQIAAANGVSRDALVSGLTSELRADIQRAQSEGRINAEMAARLLENLDERIARLVDRAGGQREGMPGSGFGGTRPDRMTPPSGTQ